MNSAEERQRVQAQAAEIVADQRTLTGAGARCKNGARVHIRRQFKGVSGPYVLTLARALRDTQDGRWFSYCLVRYHPAAFESLDQAQVEACGQGMDDKDMVDSFARILAGPAWVRGLISDALIHCWAYSEDRWWRRAALVSTVALNTRGDGGVGDTPRTLAVCRLLASDRDETVTSALAWALRALAHYDVQAVRDFVAEQEGQLATQVHREVTQALEAGSRHRGRGAG